MAGLNTNLTRVLLDQENVLKIKYGKEYRNPTQRRIDDMTKLVIPEDNSVLADLPCVMDRSLSHCG